MARRSKPREYTSNNPAYEEGSKTWKCFIGFILFTIVLKVIYG